MSAKATILAAVLCFLPHPSTLGAQPLSALKSSSLCTEDCDGYDLLRLVNKDPGNRLSASFSPQDLVRLRSNYVIPGRSAALRKEAAQAFQRLARAGKKLGFDIRIRSGYRSFAEQAKLFRAKQRKHGEEKAELLSAAPGHSQHQLGTTVDISLRRFNWKLSQRMRKTPAGKWLRRNAHRFGFVLSYPRGKTRLTGYMHEPWHYRYIGKAAAAEMKKQSLTLEEYLQRCYREDTALLCSR